MEVYRRSGRTLPSHLSRDKIQSFALSHQTSSVNSIQDSDEDRGGQMPRKRIALACSRCRKRKIKCSGDMGDGQCQNCKNAGSDTAPCQFLRVNSTTLYSPPHWPYNEANPSGTSSGMARPGFNVGHYVSSTTSSLPTAAAGSYTASAQYRGQPSHSAPSMSYLTLSGRQVYPSSYNNSFNDDILDQYPTASSTYFLPTQDLQAPVAGFSTSDGPRHWKPLPTTQGSSGSSSFDQDTTLRYAGSNYSYLNSSASSLSHAATEGSSSFPGLGSLGTSLPLHGANVGRIVLPNPNSKKSANTSLANAGHGGTTDASLPIGLQNMAYRSDVSWGTELATSSSSQSSISSALHISTDAVERPGRKSSSPQVSEDPTTFRYIAATPLGTNNPQQCDYMPTNPSQPSSQTDTHLGPSEMAFQTRLSRDTMLPSLHHPFANFYMHSTGSNEDNGSVAPSMLTKGSLANGQLYGQLRPSESQLLPSLGQRKETLEASSCHIPRASISSVSTRPY